MKQLPIIDLHQDLLLYVEHKDLFPNDAVVQTGFGENERAGVRLVTATAFPHVDKKEHLDPKTNDIVEKGLVRYGQICEENASWRIVSNGQDFTDSLDSNNPRGIILHVEGLNAFSGDAQAWEMLERWYELGLRSMGIVWNLTNSLGGGTLDPVQGLTDLGRKVIEWLQKKDMIVDFAHMNEATFWDAVDIVKGPIVISHGNARAICDDPRNYTDEQLKRVASSGGLVGVFFSKKFLVAGRDVVIDDVVRHINHLRDVMGIDHVALGTDFGGIVSGFPGELKSIERLSLLWNALSEKGYDDESIEKIVYKNTVRVIGSILRSKRPI